MKIAFTLLQKFIKAKELDSGVVCDSCGGAMIEDEVEWQFWCPYCDRFARVTPFGSRYWNNEDIEDDEEQI